MPNHWESSGRPLFVKTVFINGNRHAILSQADPLLQSGIPSLKKKRPESSLSIASVFSLSSTDTLESNEMKAASLRPGRRFVEEDISSQLQGCLIKLRLTSSIQDNNKKSKQDSGLSDSKEKIRRQISERISSKQKRKKWSIGKHSKNCRNNFEEFKDNKLEEPRNESNNCCYVYNFENNKGKKNYCFVKITSQPSQFIFKCSCDENWGKRQNFCESKDCTNWNKNNLVISATFHNLIMTDNKNEKQDSSDRWFSIENSDLCEVYLSNSHYNPLPERVIQWMDLTNKKKTREEEPETSSNEVSPGIERIFGGKTFLDENNESKLSEKIENRVLIKREKEKILQREPDRDVETEVKGEDNIETALSVDKLQNGYKEWEEIILSRKNMRSKSSSIQNINNEEERQKSDEEVNLSISIPTKIDPSLSMSTFLQNSIVNGLTPTNLNTTSVSLNIEKFLSDSDAKESLNDSFASQIRTKKSKERKNFFARHPKRKDLEEDDDVYEENDFKITAVKFWKTKINKRNGFSNRFESFNESVTFQSGKHLGECVKHIKNRNLKREFEKCKQSIDNPNITQTRPVSQNLSSPQQFSKVSCQREGKSVWAAEKDLGRPQLHIFIPSLRLTDPSEESASECESFVEEVS